MEFTCPLITLSILLGCISPQLAQMMARLWKDPATQYCFTLQMQDSHLNDSAAYFLDALDRISQDDYLPIRQDILRARLKKTRENLETVFTHEGINFRYVN